MAVTALCFAFNAAVTGEFNYQGGDRQTFYGSFPFDGTGDVWNRQASQVMTDGSVQVEVMSNDRWPSRFARNIKYFLVGRHFGFVPYFFPGVVAIAAWLFSSARRDVSARLNGSTGSSVPWAMKSGMPAFAALRSLASVDANGR